MKRGKHIIKLTLGIAIIILFVLAFYFTFLFAPKCTDYSCFNEYLKICKKASLFYEKEDTTWSYVIKGKESDACKIQVTLLQIKEGRLEIERLQGQSMDCFLPLGSVQSPEKDITQCHGELREGLQEIIIQRLHNYIVNNLGEISSALYEISQEKNSTLIQP